MAAVSELTDTYDALHERMLAIDARLAQKHRGAAGSLGMRVLDWKILQAELVAEKQEIVGRMRRIKRTIHEEAQKLDRDKTFLRCRQLLESVCAILSGFDELTNSEQTVLREAQRFVGKGHEQDANGKTRT